MFFGSDIGIDLGTANVRLYIRGKGIVLNEPSVAAMDRNSGRLLRVGEEAYRMLGRTPGNIAAISPLKGSVISDYEITERMLREFVRKVTTFSLMKPRIVICVPSTVTEIEERAVIDVGIQAGARKVYLIESAIAAATGAELDVSQAEGRMVVDVGAGTTDAAVLSLSGVVRSDSVKTAGDAFDEAIIKFIKKKYDVVIGKTTAEELKCSIGEAFQRPRPLASEVKGRCLTTGMPKTVTIGSRDILDALEEPLEQILEVIHSVLEATPPELVADISANGITLTGGGSQLWGLDRLITARTNIETYCAEDPALCVIKGIGKSLEWIDEMQEGTINLARRKELNG